MENSTINQIQEPIHEATVGTGTLEGTVATDAADVEKKPLQLRKKAKILFDILLLLIAFTGVIISFLYDFDTESFISMLKFIFPMIMYVWVIVNRIVDIFKQIG